MRILIVGGTRFVGRHITEAALAAGHDVSLLHRGSTGAELFAEATHLLADRDGDLSVLAGQRWDATIDVCGYRASQLRALAAALADGAAGQYAFISSVSVYDVPAAPNFDESSPRLELPAGADPEVVTGDTYGPLKALCERAAVRLFGPGSLIVRPTYVVGPYDPLGRFEYWVRRIAAGGEVLAPGGPDDPIQVIDARDLGRWVVEMVSRGAGGLFHTVTPRPPYSFADLLAAMVAVVGPPGTRLTWVDSDFLRAAGVTDETLPMWGGEDPFVLTLTADPTAAERAGLAPRPLAESIRDVGAAEPSPLPVTRLDRAREAALLSRWHARG